MKNTISNRQMFFSLFLSLTTYTVISIPKVIAQGAGAGGWFPLLITALAFAIFTAMIVRLNCAFPGMMLFDYSQYIVGKVMAMILALYFIIYFLILSAYLNLQLAIVLQAEFYPKTPQWVMIVASIFVFGFVAHQGVVSVARFFEVVGTVFVITAVSVHIVMFLQGNPYEVLPLFRASKLPQYLLGIKDCVIAFGGIEIVMLLPQSGKKVGRSVATAFVSILFVGLFYILVVETCIMILGLESTMNYEYALIEAIKQIDSPFLERFDVLFLTVGFAGLVAGVCGVYLALVEQAVRLFKKAKRLLIVVCAGGVMAGLGIAALALKPAIDAFETVQSIADLITSFLIPTILLVIAKVRGLVQKPQ